MTAIRAGATRRRLQLGRSQTMGVFWGLLGFVLLAYVGPNLTDETRAFIFEPPPDPLTLSFTPSVIAVTIGAVYLLVTIAAFALPDGHRVTRVGFVTASVLFIPLALVVALALSTGLAFTNVTQLAVNSLQAGTPLALGAMAGLWSERSGVVNIGIEGMLLASAGVSYLTFALLGDGQSTGFVWLAIGVGILAGGLAAALHALMSVTFRVDQIISGVVINLLALGVTGFLNTEVIKKQDFSGKTTSDIGLPVLSKIPVFGEQLFTGQPIFFLMFAVVAVSWFVLFKTAFGLRVRAVGENPDAAETVGVDVIRIRYIAVITGGLIAGLGGAWFSMESQGGFQDNMTNGAGFIALAALIFGKWRPWTAFGGAMLFGFTRALGSRLQILGVEVGDFEIPSEFWQSLPFVVTIIVVAGLIGRAIPPASIGQPFERSR